MPTAGDANCSGTKKPLSNGLNVGAYAIEAKRDLHRIFEPVVIVVLVSQTAAGRDHRLVRPNAHSREKNHFADLRDYTVRFGTVSRKKLDSRSIAERISGRCRYFLVKDKGQTNRTANALSLHIGLSIVVVMIAGATGIIEMNPLRHHVVYRLNRDEWEAMR